MFQQCLSAFGECIFSVELREEGGNIRTVNVQIDSMTYFWWRWNVIWNTHLQCCIYRVTQIKNCKYQNVSLSLLKFCFWPSVTHLTTKMPFISKYKEFQKKRHCSFVVKCNWNQKNTINFRWCNFQGTFNTKKAFTIISNILSKNKQTFGNIAL